MLEVKFKIDIVTFWVLLATCMLCKTHYLSEYMLFTTQLFMVCFATLSVAQTV
jgi:hypothetical protein